MGVAFLTLRPDQVRLALDGLSLLDPQLPQLGSLRSALGHLTYVDDNTAQCRAQINHTSRAFDT